MKLTSLMLALVILLTGCAASGSQFSGVQAYGGNSATLYIFRQSKFVGGGECPAMYLSGTKVGCLKNGGYMRVQLQAGSHKLETRNRMLEMGPEPSINFSAKPGEIVFIEWTVSISNAVATGAVTGVSASKGFVLTPRNLAVTAMQNLKKS